MKKIVVISDNHGQHEMMDYIRKIEKGADYYVHCGDSEAPEEYVKGWIAVKGNNDWMSTVPEQRQFSAEGVGIFVCHGHRIPFFDRENFIVALLQGTNCQVLLCGHSHVPEHTMIGGYHIINPGSTTLPRRGSQKSYCVITVDNGDIAVEFKEV